MLRHSLYLLPKRVSYNRKIINTLICIPTSLICSGSKMTGTPNTIGFSMGVVAKYYLFGVYTYRVYSGTRTMHSQLDTKEIAIADRACGLLQIPLSFPFHCLARYSYKQKKLHERILYTALLSSECFII
jgi:hypothetical protein